MAQHFSALPRPFRQYALVEVLAYVVAATWAIPRSNVEVVLGLVGIFAVAGLVRPAANPFGGIDDPVMGVIIVASLLWEPQDVLLGVGIGSFTGLLFFRRNELWRAATNAAGWGLPAAAAAVAARITISTAAPGIASFIIGAIAAVVAIRIVNTAIFAGFRSLRFGRPFLPEWLQTLAFQWSSQLLSTPLAVVLAAFANRSGTLLAGLGLTAAYAMALPVVRQEYAYYERSREMLDETVEAVVRALEGVDPDARPHGDRVSALAVETGRRMGISQHRLLALRLASRLHDVGLLAGPGEAAAKEHHASIGFSILAQFPDPLIAEFVQAHHERWDGTGGPDHLAGEAIPLGARILAAAEIYDSLRAGLSPFDVRRSRQEAENYLVRLAGTELDPRVTAALLQVAKEQDRARSRIP
jgi:hypothetical protein